MDVGFDEVDEAIKVYMFLSTNWSILSSSVYEELVLQISDVPISIHDPRSPDRRRSPLVNNESLNLGGRNCQHMLN